MDSLVRLNISFTEWEVEFVVGGKFLCGLLECVHFTK